MNIPATERLLLRRLESGDFDALFALYSDAGNAPSKQVALNIGLTFERRGVDEIGPFHLYSIEKPGQSPVDNPPGLAGRLLKTGGRLL